MASKLYDLQLAGFTSAGTPATGAGLIASKAIELWDDGSIKFTDAAGNKHVINDNPEFNRLISLIVAGGSGVPTTKRFHK